MEELRETINIIKSEKPDYIGIGGGDGTIHVVMTELINGLKPDNIPPVLILKEGTMNNIAATIHLKGTGDKILARMIAAIERNSSVQVITRDTIKINDKYCFIFGLGLITNFLNLVYSGGEKGLIRNLYVGVKTFIEAIFNTSEGKVFTKMNFIIEADGGKIAINPVTGILSGTVEHIGMGFTPLSQAAVFPGRFQTIILGMEPRQVLLNINKLRRGDKIYNPGYADFHSSFLTLTYNGEFEYTMDGDIYTADRELVVKSGPAISLVKV